jgi:SAM-dependent methyltransferase
MQLADLYAQRFAADFAERNAVWKVLVDHCFQRFIPLDSAVADLGAGYCEFINQVHAVRRIAIDHDTECTKHAAAGVQVVQHDLTQPWPLPDDSLDVVFTSNFLEHLPHKPALAKCLGEALRTLRRAGRFIAVGPNIRFCGNVYWDSIDHCLPLSDRSLVEALQIHGFEPELVIPRFLPHGMVNNGPHPRLVRLYLALPMLWRVFGKQFMVVARKP